MNFLLKNANLLTMKNSDILYQTDLRIENKRIAEIGKNLDTRNAQIVDCTQKYVMPGLFDSHVHYNTSEMGELFLANGITSVRNMQGTKRHLEYADEILKGKRTGPYILSTGQLYDGKQTWDSLSLVNTLSEAEQAVQDTIEAGFKWVKTYSSIPDETYVHLMKTASSCGIGVCGHMSYTLDSKVLADMGYSCVEHSSSLPRHPADIKYLAESGMWFCPTQVVCETLPDYVWDGKLLNSIEHYEYVPSLNRTFWENHNRKIIDGYKQRGTKPDINRVIERGVHFMEHSNRMLAGSDCAYPGLIAGFSLHDELKRLVSLYHMTPFEALRSATVNPALYMGLEDNKGILKPGMDADILLLNDNPLRDISATQTIHAVIQGGVLHDRSALDQMLSHVRDIPDSEIEVVLR